MKTGTRKNTFIAKIFFVIIGTITLSATANAGYINLGSLDVRPVDNQNSEYITEYLAPEENAQRKIRISNFSPETKELLIYSTETANTENGDFHTKQPGEPIKDIAGWIELPTEKLTLGPAESAVISVNLIVPKNAGVGLHTGAVMVREVPAGGTASPIQFSVEKGVRVYLNVTGPVITAAGLSALSLRETGDSFIYNLSVQNNGTVVDTSLFTAALTGLDGNLIQKTTITTQTRPDETGQYHLEIRKPKYGIYSLSLSDETGASLTRTVAIVPMWSLFSLVFGLILFASWKRKTTFCPIKIAHKLHYSNLLSRAAKIGKSLEFQRSFAYLGLAAIIMSATFSQINPNPSDLKTQLLTTPACSFDMTIKWGSLRGVPYPENYTQQWKGRINIPNSKISIVEYLHFEQTDRTELNKDKNTLYYNLETGPDNDGMIIRVEPTQNEFPYIYQINDLTGETRQFSITDHFTSEGIYPNKLGAISFKSDLCEDVKIMQKLVNKSAMPNLIGTAEYSATPNVESTPPAGVIPELDNLFIEELPSTPDVLSDFIIKSNYVQKVSRIDSTRKIETDNILIRALEATPDILEEISATPDLNFIFIPADNIIFPPMEFSFTEEKIIRQPMGTLIFVQNKESAWSTFVGTTDFQLLSGDLRIPASALSIDPGEPVILGKYKIKQEDEMEIMEEEPIILEEEIILEPEPPAEEIITEEPQPSTEETGRLIFDSETFAPEAESITAEEEITDGFEAPAQTPTEESAPTEESTPTEEPAPTEESTPTEEPAPTEEPTPTEEPSPAEEASPTEEASPAEEPSSAEESITSGIFSGRYFAFHNLPFNIFKLFTTPTAYAAVPQVTGQVKQEIQTAKFSANPSKQKKLDAELRRLKITPEALDKIKPGEERSFAGRFDKATLVNVDPTPGEKVIFMLRPTLEIRIPAGMPAGTYRGELTITSL